MKKDLGVYERGTEPEPAVPEVELRGFVEKLFYSSPKFTTGLLRLENGDTEKFRARMMLAMDTPHVFRGVWVDDPKYGHQFEIKKTLFNTELNIAGLGRYLATLKIPGLGPGRARKIADDFGDHFVDILMEDPAAIVEQSGLTLDAVVKLQEVWNEKQEENGIFTWLASYDLTQFQMTAMVDAFGSSIKDVLTTNPYQLIGAVDGFGFKRTDEIAQKLGTPLDSPGRIQAAIVYAVELALDEGHTWVDKDDLGNLVGELLKQYDISDFDGALEAVIEKERLVTVPHAGRDLIALPYIYQHETDLVSIFSRPPTGNPYFIRVEVEDDEDDAPCSYSLSESEENLADANDYYEAEDLEASPEGAEPAAGPEPACQITTEEPPSAGPPGVVGGGVSPPRALPLSYVDGLLAEIGITDLNEDQHEAVIKATQYGISLISGGAGSGKTFTITALTRLYERLGLKVALTAPTGRAAKRIEQVVGRPATTMHRLLKYNGHAYWHEGDDVDSDMPVTDAAVVIIDEVSMVDTELAWHFFQSIDLSRTMVVMVGDHNQLPPVGPGSMLRDLIERRPIPTTVLANVVRQSGQLKENSVAILKGMVQPTAPKELLQFHPPAPPASASRGGLPPPPATPGGPADGGAAVVTRQLGSGSVGPSQPALPHVSLVATEKQPAVGAPGAAGGGDSPPRVVEERVVEERVVEERELSPWIVKDHFEEAEEARRFIMLMYRELLTERLGFNLRDVQLLSPMKKGPLGVEELNRRLQIVIQKKLWGVDVRGSERDVRPVILRHDRVIQTKNDYDLGVMNGTIGVVVDVVEVPKKSGKGINRSLIVQFDGNEHPIQISESDGQAKHLSLAYALTIHKAQGAEFPCVISVIHKAHSHMHNRNLFYTSVTRAQKVAILIGNRYSMERCALNQEAIKRNTFLSVLPMREAVGVEPKRLPSRGGGGLVAPGFLFDDD